MCFYYLALLKFFWICTLLFLIKSGHFSTIFQIQIFSTSKNWDFNFHVLDSLTLFPGPLSLYSFTSALLFSSCYLWIIPITMILNLLMFSPAVSNLLFSPPSKFSIVGLSSLFSWIFLIILNLITRYRFLCKALPVLWNRWLHFACGYSDLI